MSHPLAIALLIVSMIHIPLPQPDFHNIRHHDGPGEVCGYHDHLLRWHPSAGHDVDVSILHWHWLLPGLEDIDDGGTDDGAQHHRQRSGPALHANVGDGLEPDWSGVGWLAMNAESTPIVKHVAQTSLLTLGLSQDLSFLLPPRISITQENRSSLRAHFSPLQTLQRWNC